jgi:phosphatidylinositol alpha-1,6-mannosyltransferase
MKICVLTDHFPPLRGGVSRYTYEIIYHWLKQGVEVTIVTTVIPDDDLFSYHKKVRENLYFVKKTGLGYYRAFLVFCQFIKIVFKQKPDIVFLPYWYPYSLFMWPFFYLAFKRYPFIIGCHGAEILGLHPHSSFKVRRIVKWIGRQALKNARRVFAVSNYTASEIVKLGVNPRNIEIFPNGVDYQKFAPREINRELVFTKHGIPNTKSPILLTVAQLNVRKGMDVVIKVVAKLKENNRFVRYIIVGNGEDEYRLRELITQHNLNDRVFILKNVKDDDLIELYNLCELFLLLSRHERDINVEGFGIAFLEANACKKPVIAGNSGGIPDAVDDGKSGFLVEPNNINEIKEKILYLLDNQRISWEMGKYGRQRVIEEFNWGKIASNMIRRMEGLIS